MINEISLIIAIITLTGLFFVFIISDQASQSYDFPKAEATVQYSNEIGPIQQEPYFLTSKRILEAFHG